jgi:hypothetical protein
MFYGNDIYDDECKIVNFATGKTSRVPTPCIRIICPSCGTSWPADAPELDCTCPPNTMDSEWPGPLETVHISIKVVSVALCEKGFGLAGFRR